MIRNFDTAKIYSFLFMFSCTACVCRQLISGFGFRGRFYSYIFHEGSEFFLDNGYSIFNKGCTCH